MLTIIPERFRQFMARPRFTGKEWAIDEYTEGDTWKGTYYVDDNNVPFTKVAAKKEARRLMRIAYRP